MRGNPISYNYPLEQRLDQSGMVGCKALADIRVLNLEASSKKQVAWLRMHASSNGSGAQPGTNAPGTVLRPAVNHQALFQGCKTLVLLSG